MDRERTPAGFAPRPQRVRSGKRLGARHRWNVGVRSVSRILASMTSMPIRALARCAATPGLALAALLALPLAHGQSAGAPPTPRPAPTPRATIIETATGGGRSGGIFFLVSAIDGRPTADNIRNASLRASQGRGADMRLVPFEHEVTAVRSRLKLSASHDHAMPIMTLFKSSNDASVEGEVEVDLAPNGRYRVNGVFDAFRREVWIEDAASGRVLGEKVVATLAPEVQKAMEGARFACCNLRYEGDWVSDANWDSLPMIPPGSRIKIVDIGKDRANVLAEGRPMRIGLEYGIKQTTIKAFLDRLLVDNDPREALRAFPEPIRSAIEHGKVMVGMTKPQVVMSLGHPRSDTTADLGGGPWTYWTLDEESYLVEWDSAGLVAAIRGPAKVVEQVEYRP